jgi:branched-chain amino acid aminotransferase
VSDLVSVNGRITPASEAVVSPLDRGFLYGDGVYETLRTYGSRPFRAAAHLRRLAASAERLAIEIGRAPIDPGAAVEAILARAADPEWAIRIIVTRGVGPIGYDPAACGPPTVVVHVRPCPEIPAGWRQEGVDVAIVDVTRNAVTALDPAIKSGNLLNNLLAWQAARRTGAYEPILLNPQGLLAEGGSSNLFLAHGRRLVTPDLAAGLLRGVTRDAAIELARRDGIEVEEIELRPEDLRGADEAFLTSTLKGILPIRRCDGWPIREGRPGPLTRRLMTLYEGLIQEETKAGSAPGSSLR